ncbi:hypothetical protein DDD_2168 [Nonlabens dokdonensis DSW-6]|uniref:Uncharacterized protein n=1 Tax=Nonlabens dokdonensis (strain DSM 17205 / KCTC 12402 / DSW-6) TaxID=592029 RepID=L7W6L2_NONDD|nr:hypothetical protein DDD_2168 [Nonlabens dokdonensis DSW-6]
MFIYNRLKADFETFHSAFAKAEYPITSTFNAIFTTTNRWHSYIAIYAIY